MSDNVFAISTKNITIQQDTEFNVTVSLPIAESIPVVEDKYANIKLFFGSWIKSGDEDEQLEELYKSRTFPSISIDE